MSVWMWAMLILAVWVIASVMLSLCLSAYMSSASSSLRRDKNLRRTASKLPVWIMPDCGCPQCLARRAGAQSRRDMEHAYDRSMREAFEKWED